jgi:hypothetical protein
MRLVECMDSADISSNSLQKPRVTVEPGVKSYAV